MFTPLQIQGLVLIAWKEFRDERGHFAELYKQSDFKSHGIQGDFLQDNRSVSGKQVLRGLHYQLEPKAQGKLIRVVRGKIFDAVVDLRRRSTSYGKCYAVTLSENETRMLWVPPGFAHGFLALEENTEISYKTTREYDPQFERGLLWNDPGVGIAWPIKNPILSDRDRNFPRLSEAENNFES